MKKLFRRIVSVMLCVAMLASFAVTGIASPVAKENVLIAEYKDALDWLSADRVSISGGVSGTRATLDFSTIDANDEVHGEVLKYYYKEATTVGTVEKYADINAVNSPNKRLSMEFYLSDNKIPYEIRLMAYDASYMIGQFQFNKFEEGDDKTQARVGILVPGQASGAERAHLFVSNGEWHKIDVIMDAENVKYFVDGKYLGTLNIPEREGDVPVNFGAIQYVTRANTQAADVDSNSGVYFDNVKVYLYDENSEFYGIATETDDKIVVKLSETVAYNEKNDFGSISVYNTKTEEVLQTETPVFNGIDEITIPLIDAVEEGVEYMVKLPATVKGISGKSLNEVAYFTPEIEAGYEYLYTQNLDSYTELTDNNTDVMSTGGAAWLKDKIINIADLSSSSDADDAAHKNVMYLTNTSKTTSAYDYRGGIQFGGNKFDISENEYIVEFDMKIPNTDYSDFFIQPYTYMEGLTDSEQTRMSISRSTWYDIQTDRLNQLCTLSVSSSNVINAAANTPNHPGWIQLIRNSDRALYAREWNNVSYHGNAATYGYTVMDPKEWHTIKLAISKTETDYAKVKLYVDDEYVTDNTVSTAGSGATNLLYGIRFSVMIPAYSTSQGPFLYLDNVKVSTAKTTTAIEKIRIEDYDGSAYGPMTEDVQVSAQKAVIHFTDEVDVSEATVTLSSSSSEITTTLGAFDETNNTVEAVLDGTLKKDVTYTVKVSGVKSLDGKTLSDAVATFKTDVLGKFVIENLMIADANGEKIDDVSAIALNDEVSAKALIVNTLDETKTVAIITAVYNDGAMTDVNYAEYDLPTGTVIDMENEVSVTVNNLDKLVVKGYAWESLENNKPLMPYVECK
ncbi:MAG: hypothetical protein E7415_05465 [Ruminococcaceae bacterium]|nr:hypothetical protein [Oscillospiraceae bacterium]